MAELNISKKTIKELFGEMQNRKFVIPDYQRPYKWDIEKCETLWNDIENFAVTEAQKGVDYFLGTIVSYQTKNNNGKTDLEIIDGQQRITTLLLILRAFYRKLENMNAYNQNVIGLKNQLAPCIWDIDPISQIVSDTTKIHIASQVATEEDNDTFHKILETGNTNENTIDNYSVNYRFLKEQCDRYAKANPMQWQQLCVTILKNCIILPIECAAQETALTIFSTLNDRGMPLSDSDIFKAQIYRNFDTEEKRKEFTQIWKDLTQICKKANMPLDDIFRYYTHVIRARNEDKSKEIGLRSFYANNKYEKLKADNLISEIMQLANFWLYLNTGNEADGEIKYTISVQTKQYLHCLRYYPNEYWKYIVSVFFMKNRNSDTFDNDFCSMLKKLIAFLFAKFIETPTVNAIKDDIFAAYISIQKENKLQVKFNLDEELIRTRITGYSYSKISRALLLLDTYLNPEQNELISDIFEIEHIFPKKWQEANYNGWNIEDAQLYLDYFGNKVVFEKKLNIQAGNGYFGNKKQKYILSKIANVVELGNYPKNDWTKEDIEERESKFIERIIAFFKKHYAAD
ncbi:MAG: DUF262 domain-containing HNH endonuclease family protein [Campylobacteraceae bacterium]|jgi:uncharacterized protein with ParB-like and HNH nuclease domain|nr:DUF262 domain-containing HNH endonuclease family protein [Campylobacteraceae bacterium]